MHIGITSNNGTYSTSTHSPLNFLQQSDVLVRQHWPAKQSPQLYKGPGNPGERLKQNETIGLFRASSHTTTAVMSSPLSSGHRPTAHLGPDHQAAHDLWPREVRHRDGAHLQVLPLQESAAAHGAVRQDRQQQRWGWIHFCRVDGLADVYNWALLESQINSS